MVPQVRLYTRNASDLTARLPAIAAVAERIKAKSFTIDGEAVVLGPDNFSLFDELRRRKRRRHDSSRASWLARKSEKSIGFILVQMPPGERKSGIPHSVEMPAPVNGTILLDPSIRARRRSMAVGTSGAIMSGGALAGASGLALGHRSVKGGR